MSFRIEDAQPLKSPSLSLHAIHRSPLLIRVQRKAPTELCFGRMVREDKLAVSESVASMNYDGDQDFL
ncbi:hypothetical protein NB709_003080 [Xanthomonas sacchari]|nr:hypothetical protein [Xanthomonas sacchari]